MLKVKIGLKVGLLLQTIKLWMQAVLREIKRATLVNMQMIRKPADLLLWRKF